MSCITGKISLSDRIVGSIERATASLGGGMAIQTMLRGSISVICPLPLYVFVEPEIIWLNEGNAFSMDVEVKSNTDWTIE